MNKRQSWVMDILTRAILNKISGEVAIRFDKGLIVGCRTEQNEKPPIDVTH